MFQGAGRQAVHMEVLRSILSTFWSPEHCHFRPWSAHQENHWALLGRNLHYKTRPSKNWGYFLTSWTLFEESRNWLWWWHCGLATLSWKYLWTICFLCFLPFSQWWIFTEAPLVSPFVEWGHSLLHQVAQFTEPATQRWSHISFLCGISSHVVACGVWAIIGCNQYLFLGFCSGIFPCRVHSALCSAQGLTRVCLI